MPSQPTDTRTRLNNITTCLTLSATTLELLASALKAPFLHAIWTTIQSLLRNVELMEQTHGLLNAIIMVYINSETAGELPPSVVHHIGKFTETLHRIHSFIEAQQSGNKVKKFFQQGEMNILLKDCKAGLEQGIDFFLINTVYILDNAREMVETAQKRHKEVLDMIETLSDATSSEGASALSRLYSGNSSNSLTMLPSKPKIFYGRESELSSILSLFSLGSPTIAILGTGGMGKTSLAKAVLHHPQILATYGDHRCLVACDSAASKAELVALVGAHLGLKPGKDLTRPILQHFASGSPSLLILDNLETSWEPRESRNDVEDFLSLLTEVEHLALIITMRGAERPAKVCWTRPFLLPLQPLEQNAARQIFIEIADDTHDPAEVDELLLLTDNLPLAVNLLAHLVDAEGCSNILARWQAEKTSIISDGPDRRYNLDLSISLSLSSARIKSVPHSPQLLSLLSMLPDGLSDADIIQSGLPIHDIFSCKAALIRTALAYQDEQKQLKVLVPIREYMQKNQPPPNHLLRSLFKHFQGLLELYCEYEGTEKRSPTIARISSNLANIHNVLSKGLQQDHPDLEDTIACTLHLNLFCREMGQGPCLLFCQLHDIIPCSAHRLQIYFVTELFRSWPYYPISHPETLVSQTLAHFENFDDPDLKCRFYLILARHYQEQKFDFPTAIDLCQSTISLASSTGNYRRQSQALCFLASINWSLGNYSASQTHAKESQRLAWVTADFFVEAQGLRIEALSWTQLSNYKQSVALCNRARDLLNLCGMARSKLAYNIMDHQAEIHRLKSEYKEAKSIQIQILQDAPINEYGRAFGLMNLAEISLAMGAPRDSVNNDMEKARERFQRTEDILLVTMCDSTLAELFLREGDLVAAKTLFEKCVILKDSQIKSYCLERLGNVSRWGVLPGLYSWTTVFLVHSLHYKEKLGTFKALQFMGDVFLAQDDEQTVINLYTVALLGFTEMDVHRSRAECMLRLGDIYRGHMDLLGAVEYWKTARSLFERSSQANQVKDIDRRLAPLNEQLQVQHRKRLALLMEHRATSRSSEELEDDPSDIE